MGFFRLGTQERKFVQNCAKHWMQPTPLIQRWLCCVT